MCTRKTLLASLLLTGAVFCSQSFAALVDPATEEWGGWTRGTGNTVYVHFDDFSADGFAPFPPNPPADLTPDVADYGADPLLVGTAAYNPSTIITPGDNLLSFGGPSRFTTYVGSVGPIDTGPGGLSVALQLITRGPEFDPASTVLQDAPGGTLLAPDSIVNLGGTGPDDEWLLLWTLPEDITNYGFTYGTNGVSGAVLLSEAVVDIGPSPVPLPPAVWLFGSALIGLVAVSRMKQDV